MSSRGWLLLLLASLLPQLSWAQRTPEELDKALFEPLLEILGPGDRGRRVLFHERGFHVDSTWHLEDPAKPALVIQYLLEPGVVRLQITALKSPLGERNKTRAEIAADMDEPLGQLELKYGETPVSLPALDQVGITDVRFRIVPRRAEILSPLRVISVLESIRLHEIEETQGRFYITMTNETDKGIVAIFANGLATSNSYGHEVLKARGERAHGLRKRTVREANRREGIEPFVVEFNTVIFSDLTHEGRLIDAARYFARAHAKMLQLEVQLKILDEMLELQLEGSIEELLQEAVSRLEAIPEQPPVEEIEQLRRRFVALDPELMPSVERTFRAAWSSTRRWPDSQIFFVARNDWEQLGPEATFEEVMSKALARYRRWIGGFRSQLDPLLQSH